jgi:hypothetical protein
VLRGWPRSRDGSIGAGGTHMKFDAFETFRRDLTRLRTLYEASTQAYDNLHEIGKKTLRKADHPHNVEFKVGAKTIKRPWKTVTSHARDVYPRTLRSVILVQAVSIYEVFIVAIMSEMIERSRDWLKDDGRINMSHSELMTILAKEGIEQYLLDRHANNLTRGSLSDKAKFFNSRFEVQLTADETMYAELEEVHDRRNIYVHRMGLPDALYVRKYPAVGAKEGVKVPVTTDYLDHALEALERSARHIVRELDLRFPEAIAPKYTSGAAKLTISAGQLHLVTVRCLSVTAATLMADQNRVLPGGTPLERLLVWMCVVERKVTYLVSGPPGSLRPFFKQIAIDEEAGEISIEQSVRIDRKGVERLHTSPDEDA